METKTCRKRNHVYDSTLPRCPECAKLNTLAWHKENLGYKRVQDKKRAARYRREKKKQQKLLEKGLLHGLF